MKKKERKKDKSSGRVREWMNKGSDTLISGQTSILLHFPHHPLFPNCLSSPLQDRRCTLHLSLLQSFSAAPSFPQLQRCPTDQPFPQLAPYSGIRKTNIHGRDVAVYFSPWNGRWNAVNITALFLAASTRWCFEVRGTGGRSHCYKGALLGTISCASRKSGALLWPVTTTESLAHWETKPQTETWRAILNPAPHSFLHACIHPLHIYLTLYVHHASFWDAGNTTVKQLVTVSAHRAGG